MTSQAKNDEKLKALTHLIDTFHTAILKTFKDKKEAIDLLLQGSNSNDELNGINKFLQEEIDTIVTEFNTKIENEIIPKLKKDFKIDFSLTESTYENIAKKVREDTESRKL